MNEEFNTIDGDIVTLEVSLSLLEVVIEGIQGYIYQDDPRPREALYGVLGMQRRAIEDLRSKCQTNVEKGVNQL